MHVALIGPGRLGRSLAVLLPAAGIPATLVRRGEPLPEADVYWLVVRDAALPEVAARVPHDRIVLHAAGALGPEVLHHPLGGVLHPLMTFPGPELGLPNLAGVGARVDGAEPARAVARVLAGALGMVCVEDVDPVAWHAAASMVSGHIAALFLDAVAVLDRGRSSVDPPAAELLLPLALESLVRAAAHGGAAITGPAARGDVATVALHLGRLQGESEVYRALDKRIRERCGR